MKVVTGTEAGKKSSRWQWLGLVFLWLCTPLGVMGAPNPPGWILTFHDEFSGHTLNSHLWTASVGSEPTRSMPVQYYLPSQVSVRHGTLIIRTERRGYAGYPYVSGEVRTQHHFAQQYGRFDVRCRFPRTQGSWAAAYLLPEAGYWPPEIDITEFVGRMPSRIVLTTHWADAQGAHQQINRDWDAPGTDWAAWHVYSVEWGPNSVRWSIDGHLRGAITDADCGPDAIAHVPLYLRLNSAVGGAFAHDPSQGRWPQVFQVDYVRVYRRFNLPVVAQISALSSPIIQPLPLSLPTAIEPGAWAAIFALLAAPWLIWTRGRTGAARLKIALTVATASAALYYLSWRTGVANWHYWAIAGPLLLAEAFGIAQALGFHYTVWPRQTPPLQKIESAAHPIFVFIPTVDEGAAVLEPTIRGAQAARARYLADFPGTPITIVVCNDGRVAGRENWREAERVAERRGVVCVTRELPGGAKAGNIENARRTLSIPSDALMAIFDADMVARPEFFLQSIPPFADPNVGWVQTGQYYHNLENPVARWANDQQSLFFDVLSAGKAAQNALFICGTNVVVRVAALDEIGGLPQDSVTEDFAASILLHPRWRCVYLPDVLATGLGPLDLSGYFTQQNRWAVGTLGVLRRRWPMLLLPPRDGGLSGRQRVQYALSCTHYLSGICNVVYFIAPLLYLLAGISALHQVTLTAMLSHFLPYFVLSQMAFWYATGGRTHLRGSILGYGSAAVLSGSLLTVLAGRRLLFMITPKRRETSQTWRVLLPHMCAVIACIAGLWTAWGQLGGPTPLTTLCAAWLAWSLTLLAAMLWLGVLDRRAARPIVAQDFSVSRYNNNRTEHDARRDNAMGLTDQYYGASTAGLNKVILDFGLCTLQGEFLYTAKARTKGLLVVIFFGTNSDPSTRALKAVQEWTASLPGAKWSALAVGEGGRDELTAYQTQNGLDALTFLIDHELYTTRRWGVSHLPSVYVISGKTGQVMAKVMGDYPDALASAKTVLQTQIDVLVAADEAAKQAAEAAAAAAKA